MIRNGAGGAIRLEIEYWPVIWLWPLALVLMQVTLAVIGGFALTIAALACHLLQLHLVTFYWLKRPPHWQVLVALATLAYSLALGLVASDSAEFWQSFAHLANLVLTVVICLNVRIGRGHEIGRSLVVFCIAAALAAAVIIAQAVSFNVLRDFGPAGLLGDFAPIGPGGVVYEPSPRALLARANGFYSEPSVAGWFMTFAAAIALGARPLHPLLGTATAALCSLGAMATLSLTGILGPALIWAGHLLLVRDRCWFKATAGLIAIVGIGAAFHQAHELGILSRFANVEAPGTSMYFRLTAPSRLIGDSLARFPFGHPLGQTDFIAGRHYYINWKLGSQTNIDNTLFMVVFYFGLLGIAFNVGYLIKAAQYLVVKRHAIGLLMLSLLLALATTGAGFAHHVVLMVGYAIVVGRYLFAHQALALSRLKLVWRAPLIPPRSGAPAAPAALLAARSPAA